MNDAAGWGWFGKSLQESIENAEQAFAGFQALEKFATTPSAFKQKWVYAAFYWKNLLHASYEVYQASLEVSHRELRGLLGHYQEASQDLKAILDFRKECFRGEWAEWLSGDKKLDIPDLSHFLGQEGKRLLSHYQEGSQRMPEEEGERKACRLGEASQ